MKLLTTSLLFVAVFLVGGMVDRIETQPTLGLALVLNEAEAGPARRSMRRTARRTSRRTSRRVNRRRNYYRGGYYGPTVVAPLATAAAVTAGALAIGAMVASLPSGCRKVIVDNRVYHDCSGTWYEPRYDGAEPVYVVVDPPR